MTTLSATALPERPIPGPAGGPAIREVLFATDLSRPSDLAFDHASRIAERFGARLTLYHVVETSREEPAPRPGDLELEAARRAEQAARDRLLRLAEGSATATSVFVERRASARKALVGYLDWRHPDLTVMATHGRHGLARVFLGSVAEHVLQRSQRPLLCVRPSAHGTAVPYRRILLPTDLQPSSQRALPVAAMLARAFDAEVLALHVAALPPAMALPVIPAMVDRAVPEESAVRQFLGDAFDGLRVSVRVRLGAVCEGIIEAARSERADCVVMATCRHNSLQDRILGTHAERVIRTAPCPVLAL